MKKCKQQGCGVVNDNHAIYCRACGHPLGRRLNWPVILLAVVTIAALAFAGLYAEKLMQMRLMERGITQTSHQATNQVRALQQEVDSLRVQCLVLDSQKTAAAHRLADFQAMVGKYYPLIIDSIKIANVNYMHEVIDGFGARLVSERTQYLQPQLHYRGIMHGEVEFTVRWFTPEHGWFKSGAPRLSHTQRVSAYIYEEQKTVNLKGLGNSTPGFWSAGRYKIEIWYGKVLLASQEFSIM